MRKSSKSVLLASCLLVVGLAGSQSAYAESQSISVTGNGSNSVSTISSDQNQSTFVTQSNNAKITNDISVTVDTGHNKADSNTNSDSAVSTGSIFSSIATQNNANSNSSNGCCIQTSNDPATILVQENGSHSSNQVNITNTNQNVVQESNTANVQNSVHPTLNTGGNSSSSNTGGNSNIATGNIFSSIVLENNLNKNTAQLGCCQIIKEIVTPVGEPPVATVSQNPGQVLTTNRVAVLPNTGPEDNMWIMSLASMVLLLGFAVRSKAGPLLASLGA